MEAKVEGVQIEKYKRMKPFSGELWTACVAPVQRGDLSWNGISWAWVFDRYTMKYLQQLV